MITKKDFCENIIYNFMKDNCYNVLRDIHVLESSSLAVAMEYLGKIKDKEMQEYAQSRGGTHILTYNGKLLSTRELLELLPE